MSRSHKAPLTLNYAACGRVFEREMLREHPTINKWWDAHGRRFSLPTLYRICNGSYNTGSYLSLDLQWSLALEICHGDTHRAQLLNLVALQELGVIPRSTDRLLLNELSEIATHFRRVARSAKQLASNQAQQRHRQRAASVPSAATTPATSASDDGQSSASV